MRNKIFWSDETKMELFPECQASCLEETWHHGWQHHAVGMFISGMDWETIQDRGKDEWRKVQRSLMKS